MSSVVVAISQLPSLTSYGFTSQAAITDRRSSRQVSRYAGSSGGEKTRPDDWRER